MLIQSDPFVFTRASNGAWTNAAGLVSFAGNNVARQHYISGQPVGTRIEGAITNAFTNSAMNSNQFAGASTANASWTQNGPTAPDGSGPTWKLTGTTVGAVRGVSYPAHASLNGAQVIFSAYCRADGINKVTLAPYGNSAAGGGYSPTAEFTLTGAGSTNTPATSGIQKVGNSGWYRCWTIWTQTASNSGNCAITLNVNDVVDTVGGVAVWGVQLEANYGNPSSLVVTNGAAAARALDTWLLSGSNFTSLMGTASAGAIMVECMMPQAAGTGAFPVPFYVGDGTNASYMLVVVNNGSSFLSFETKTGGGASTKPNAGNFTAGTPFRIGMKWNSSGIQGCLNGGTIVNVGVAPPTALTQIKLGNSYGTGNPINGYLSKVQIFAHCPTDAEWQTICTVGQ